MMDVVFTVGQYTLVSMVLNTLGIERDEGVVGSRNETPRQGRDRSSAPGRLRATRSATGALPRPCSRVRERAC